MMKKILIALLIVIGFSMSISAQTLYWVDNSSGKNVLRQVSTQYPLPITLTGFNFNPTTFDTNNVAFLNKNNVFTGVNTFSKVYIDSLILRVYLLDTGTAITRSLIPQTTRLYNFGGSSNYWLNTYTQNIYVDTVKTDLILDKRLTVKGLVTIDSLSLKDVIPVADSTYNLGSSTNAFKDAYIDGYLYLAGNATTDGSWRFYAHLSGDLIFETRVSGVWTEKSRITK